MSSTLVGPRSRGPMIIIFLVVLLLILHQDNWFWTDRTLVFGILPIGMFWHVLLSVAASLTWFLATKIAWPLSKPLSEPVSKPAGSDSTEGTSSHSVLADRGTNHEPDMRGSK